MISNQTDPTSAATMPGTAIDPDEHHVGGPRVAMFHGLIFFYPIPVLHCGERKLVGVQLVGDFDTLKRDKRIKASRETIAAALVGNILPALPSNQAYFIPATGPHPLNHWSAGLTGNISHGKDLKRLDRERSGSFQSKK